MNKNENILIFENITPVRIDDINFGNHLDHARLISILHNARASFFHQLNFSESNCFGLLIMVESFQIQYISQAKFNDKLKIKIFLEGIKGARMILSYLVENLSNNKVIAKSAVQMVFFNPARETPTRAPKELISLIQNLNVTKLL